MHSFDAEFVGEGVGFGEGMLGRQWGVAGMFVGEEGNGREGGEGGAGGGKGCVASRTPSSREGCTASRTPSSRECCEASRTPISRCTDAHGDAVATGRLESGVCVCVCVCVCLCV
jgi:hypothetical protein